MNEYSVLIPIRIASRRLVGKPLLEIYGLPLFVYLFRRVSRHISRIFITTHDSEIIDVCKTYNIPFIRTSDRPRNGSERVCEAILKAKINSPIIVNLQSDEIDADRSLIEDVVDTLIKKRAEVSTAITPLKGSERDDKDVVKTVVNRYERCIYFSRSPIPFERERTTLRPSVFRHIGIYCYRRDTLLRYKRLRRTYLEEVESLEQMRLIENGIDIYGFVTKRDYRKIDNIREFDKIKGKRR